MGFEKDFKKIIEGSIGIAVKTASELSDKTGVNQASLSMFLSGKRKNLNLESVAKILDFLGATIHTPDSDPTREVVFVNPRVHQDYSGLPIPTPDDYRAIPLTSAQVAAGPGLVNDSSELKSWVLVYTGEKAIELRTRLIAVRVAKGQKSMLPGIQPGDIVVIDLDDKDIKHPGIFLVRDPDEGEALKRVKFFTKRGKPAVTFYSDNAAAGYEPSTYDLDEFAEDPHDAIDRAIVGRCVWQWGDLEHR